MRWRGKGCVLLNRKCRKLLRLCTFSRGHRRAVPGDETARSWRLCRDVQIRKQKAEDSVSGAVRGWRALACGAFGLRHAVPLCRNTRKAKKRTMSRFAPRIAQPALRCYVGTGTIACATERQKRRPEASDTKGGDGDANVATRLLLWFGLGLWLWPGGRRGRLRGSRTCSG